MRKIDWYYHRKNCNTCAKAETFFATHPAEKPELVIANKVKFDAEGALAIAADVEEVYSAKGSTVVALQAKEATRQALLDALLGPHGTLRAPTIRVGNTLLVGFHEPTYLAVFADSQA
jgi:arsenate reductase-like glutaredoxin family protein